MTNLERLILANQFQILAVIRKDDEYLKLAKVAERGFTGQYDLLFAGLSREVAPNICDEVADILDMYRALTHGYEALPDKGIIPQERTTFYGFDANNEGEHLAYARFLIEDLGYWKESSGAGDGLNSHCPTLDRYRRMVVRWKESANIRELSAADLLRITDRQPAPVG
jgi:uncharacterized protein YfbU (UPF0304 family)